MADRIEETVRRTYTWMDRAQFMYLFMEQKGLSQAQTDVSLYKSFGVV